MAKYGRETNDADIRARQQRDLDKASKMMEEDRNPETLKKYTADQLEKRLRFMTDAMYQARKQRELDAEIADKPKREAASELQRETRRGKQPESSGFGPKLTFLTPERLAKSREAMEGMKKGGAVKKYAQGGLSRAELKKQLQEEKPYVPPSSGKDKKEADIFREGMKPPSPDEGPVTLPGKPGKAPEPKNLPGKPEKKKPLGEGATKYAKGGYVRAADGIAKRGKTKGRIV